MKRTTIILAGIGLTGIFLSACCKTYVCECTDGTENVVNSIKVKAKNESAAGNKCREFGDECGLMR